MRAPGALADGDRSVHFSDRAARLKMEPHPRKAFLPVVPLPSLTQLGSVMGNHGLTGGIQSTKGSLLFYRNEWTILDLTIAWSRAWQEAMAVLAYVGLGIQPGHCLWTSDRFG